MNEEKIEYEYYTVDFEGVNSRYTMYDKIMLQKATLQEGNV